MARNSSGYQPRSVKGMHDLLPPVTAVWAAVEARAREVFRRYAFEEIRTPIVEDTELFVRSVGESSEIVGKQMYTWSDKSGKSLCLRPESTAAVARAFVQHGLRDRPLPLRLFYIGPHFRYERPQKGRYRQFSQIGAELIGDDGPWSDVEIVRLLFTFLESLGFQGLEARVNTVGDRDSRTAYGAVLRNFLEPRAEELTEDSRRRLLTNPLRILDTKVPAEIALLEGAPRLADHLSADSRDHFDRVLLGLDQLGVRYRVEDRLVRGLDYYTRTVFEIVSSELGAQDALVGGGRYDGLIGEVGGDAVPGIGFAIGLDRLIETLPSEFLEQVRDAPPVLVLAAGEVGTLEAMKLAEELRGAGIPASCEVGERSFKASLRRANRLGIDFVALIGEDELQRGQVRIRDFRSGEQNDYDRAAVAQELRRLRSE